MKSTTSAVLAWALALLALVSVGTFANEGSAGTLDELIDEIYGTTPQPSDCPYGRNCRRPSRTPRPTPPPTAPPSRPPTAPPTVPTTATPPQGVCPSGQRCVQVHLCSNNSKTGALEIDIRQNADNPCVDYLLQCCYEEDIIRPSTTTTPHPPIEETKCGKRNPNGFGFRVVNDFDGETQYTEFPWMMAVLQRELVLDEPVDTHLGGGSLIHPRVVLTVAHNVHTKKEADLKVRGGEWDTRTAYEILPFQDRDVSKIEVHYQFNRAALYNDIAILFLTTPFNLNEGIQPVCLPPPWAVFDRRRCIAMGWGKDSFGNAGRYQAILKKVELPVVPSAECQEALRKERVGPTFELHNSFICAGGEPGRDICKGDGGAPLVCPIAGSNGHYYQAGIVSWGLGCGGRIPGVYTAVNQFREWIDSQLKARKIDSRSYTYQ